MAIFLAIRIWQSVLHFCFGFEIPVNFNLPYFASSPVDFWKRWHISLSSWLRDYVYISLGGKKNNRYRNIMITMLLGGLWHGAAWTFVIWGFFHAILIIVTHLLTSIKLFSSWNGSKNIIINLTKCLVTFYLVLISWVFFRATDISSAFEILANMHLMNNLPDAPVNIAIISILTIPAFISMHLFDFVIIRYGEAIKKRAWLLWPLLILFQLVCFIVGDPNTAFIYFQF